MVEKKSIRSQRKGEIIKAFYKVAKKEGLENASIAKVAEKAGVNPSLVIHYFESREGLMLALNEFILKQYLKIYIIDGNEVHSTKGMIEIIDNLFSRKWNRLFDDGVFYSCYAQIYRNNQFKLNFKALHDLLHEKLKKALDEAVSHGVIDINNTKKMAQTIFALVDGAYYYLGLVDDKTVYQERLSNYRNLALSLLNLD